ncbi:NAD(P)-binding protein [Exidia glandulosa HHB12029]|uniref:NAD(P)-binding protein n=1 Tax=Exidia glandulosa HHB12029 TaxID=1314781 RepID=A0A165MKJ0_EXIGL|nr:NAD(P)-binding protein [Exidia glandulosa HHB12029]
MSQDDLKIFILGVTGYIGSSFLARLVKLYPTARISALIRSDSVITTFLNAGVHEAIHGTHLDHEKIRDASSKADIVMNIADCDDVGLTVAVLEGMKQHFEATGRRPILIHTSGTGVISDGAHGVLNPAVAAAPFDDADEERIKSIPATAPHRYVDNLIFDADKARFIDGWIVTPPTIYGPSSGVVTRGSVQIPVIVKLALAKNKAVYLGDGTATWDNAHLEDVLGVFEVVLAHALKPETRAATISPYAKFVLISAGKHTWGEMTQLVARALYKRGVIPTEKTEPITWEEASALDSRALYVGTNSFAIPTRALQLGWQPKHLDWRSYVDADVEGTLKSLGKL